MHELSVTQGMLDIVLRHAQQAGAQRITHIHLLIGDLSSIVDDSIQFYFDMLAEGTMAEGGQLSIDRVPALVRCLACGNEYGITDGNWICPACSAMTVDVVREWVGLAHQSELLVLNVIATSQEGASVSTIEQLALLSKMTGADMHHIGDAGTIGIAVPENIRAWSMALRGRRHTWHRMAASVYR